MCSLLFAFNRLDYAQNIPDYMAHMQELETQHPEKWQVLYESQFTVQNNEIPFTSVGVDHAQYFANQIHKRDGGLSGITTKPDTLSYITNAGLIVLTKREINWIYMHRITNTP